MSENKELSLQQHAMQEIDAVAAGLDDLTTKYKGVVYDVTTTKGMADAKAARLEIREPRYAVERIRKGKVSELSAISKAINTRAAEITSQITALEDPIDGLIKGEEDRKAAEKAERERAEAERIKAMENALQAIRNVPLHAVGKPLAEMQSLLDELAGTDMAVFDEVYLTAAKEAMTHSSEALSRAIAERAELDRQQAELAAQKAENERVAREQEEARRAQQEADDQARKEREQAEAAAREEEAAKQRRIAEVSRNIDNIRRQAFASLNGSEQIRDAIEALSAGPLLAQEFDSRVQEAESARAETLEALTQRLNLAVQQEEHEAQKAEAQRKADQEAQERAAREAQELADKQAAEAQRETAAAEAAIQAATAREAMEDALECLRSRTIPLEDDDAPVIALAIRKLQAVLSKEIA